MDKTTFICFLPSKMQDKIKEKLASMGYSNEDIERALNSRLCDLEDTIDLELIKDEK